MEKLSITLAKVGEKDVLVGMLLLVLYSKSTPGQVLLETFIIIICYSTLQ